MITVVTGPPCSGKSTHIEASAGPDDVRIDFDRLAVALGAKAAHAAAGAIREVAHTVRLAAIERVLSGISADAWIIHSCPSIDQIETYKAAGALLVDLDPGLEEALARSAADGRPDGTEQAIRAWYSNREGKAQMNTKTTEVARRLKSFTPTSFKAAGQTFGDETLADGEFIALAAVFGNIDSYGDRIIKGAFADTLAGWSASGDPVPVIWQHNWADPFAHIGEVVWARETDEGLLYKGRLDVTENPFAAQVYGLMKGRRVTQQSFGFDVQDGNIVIEDGVEVFQITKAHLFEVGPCLVGVNTATNLLDIKSSGAAAILAAAEPSGQALTPAAGVPSTAPGSDLETPASKSETPASVLLSLDLNEFLKGES